MQRTTKLLGYLEYKVHQWTKLGVGYIHEYRKRPTFMDVFKAFKGFGGVSITPRADYSLQKLLFPFVLISFQ